MIWLVVEYVTFVGVIVPSGFVVIHDILIGMAQHIGTILALFKTSSFGHA